MSIARGEPMTLRLIAGGREIVFEPRRLIVAGYTGRDQAAVARHVAELAKLGVPEPPETPTFYELSPLLLTAEAAITVGSAQTSGEVEPVLFRTGGRCYVGVGSDHTARDLERIDIGMSKAACPKVVGTAVIDYGDAVTHWDRLALRSRIGADADIYQEGHAGELLPIPDLLSVMRARGGVLSDGTVVFLGTLALKSGTFVYSDRWALEMALPDGPTIECSYEVGVVRNQPEVTS
jgi:4-hydroxyphenylacetate 3-monooxygenase